MDEKVKLNESSDDDAFGALLTRRAPAVIYAAVCFCFFLSGFAALLYQTAWLRLFSTHFGTSEYAVTIVLASYMGGLALGAWIASRYLHRIQYPILVYGFLELLIGVSALFVPILVTLAGLVFGALVGGQAILPDAGGFLQPGFYIVASMIILGIPTTCMGATLPILMRHVIRTDQQIGNRTGLLYGINTVGAVFGTITAAFVLLPALGMKGTVWLGVGINILVYLIAIIIVLVQGFNAADRALKPQLDLPLKFKGVFKKNSGWMLPLILGSGLVSFIYEVLWTRLLGHVVGGSVAAFSTMLAAFLTGIAFGGLLGGILARTKRSAVWWFIAAQVLIAICSVYIYFKLNNLIPDVRDTKAHARMAYLVMVPATIFIGMTFPLAVRILSDNARQASTQAALLYTWNTCGAVMGALLAGFLIIPVLGFEGTIVVCIVANLSIAILVSLTQLSVRQKWMPASLCFVLVVCAGTWQPTRPDAIIHHSLFAVDIPADINEEFYAVGRSATILSLSSFENIYYRSNGLPEAAVSRKGASPTISSQQWLGTIPPLLRPQARNMLVVGYGGGAVLEAIPKHIQNIDVVELEPEIINANRTTAHLRKFDPLADPRINIVVNDARNALQLSRKKFDIIVSQPSHPWTAGASHLFTKEYMALAKGHLNHNGVFLQWINAEFVSEALLRDLTATLLSEFKYVRLAQISPGALHFYASNAPLNIEARMPDIVEVISGEPDLFLAAGINSFYDIVATIILDGYGTRKFAATGKIIRDDQNQLAVHSRQFGGGLSQKKLMALLQPYDPFVHSVSLKVRDMPKEQALYILSALVRVGMLNRAWEVMKTLDTEEFRTLGRAAIYKANGNFPEAANAAKRARDQNQLNDNALFIEKFASLSRSGFQTNSHDFAVVGKELETVFNLTEAGSNANWQLVYNQDGALMEIPVTRTYAGQVMYLRAQARTRLATHNQDRLVKAMALIERSILIEPSFTKLELRAELADRLNDSNRVVNSLWQINEWLVEYQENGTQLFQDFKQQRRDKLHSDVKAYLSMLDRISEPDLEARISSVRYKLSQLDIQLMRTGTGGSRTAQ